jgi:hypothetical protein
MNIGEVYFIGERDRSTGKLTENVKIGMVGTKGDSRDRLKQHQTGNPRDLVLHHVVETPAPFWVENGLHQRLNGLRVRAEWHRLDTKGLENAIRLAEALAGESFVHIPFINEQERLKKCVSNGETIEPTDESSDWQLRLSKAKAQLDCIKNLQTMYKNLIDGLSKEEIEQAIQEDLFYIEYYTETTFDENEFTKKYPDLVTKYTLSDTETGGRMTQKYLDLKISEIDPSLQIFSNEFTAMCEKVAKREVEFGDLTDRQSQMQSLENVSKWERDISIAHLASICGVASGITGQLTWNRSEKTTTWLDKEALESNHSEKYNEFVTVKTKSRKKIRKRARRTLTTSD